LPQLDDGIVPNAPALLRGAGVAKAKSLAELSVSSPPSSAVVEPEMFSRRAAARPDVSPPVALNGVPTPAVLPLYAPQATQSMVPAQQTLPPADRMLALITRSGLMLKKLCACEVAIRIRLWFAPFDTLCANPKVPTTAPAAL